MGTPIRKLGLPMLVTLVLAALSVGLPVRASGWAVVFFDDFSANTGWNVSPCGDAPGGHDGCQWPGQAIFGHSDGGASVLRLAQDGGVTFPLVGREGLFSSIPAGARWAFEIRFRFPEVTVYGVTIGLGSGSWNTNRYGESACGQHNTDWSNALDVHQNQAIGLWIKAFGTPILQSPAPDTAWHTIRVEVQPDMTWRAFVDGNPAGSGSGAFRPNLAFFGNYCHQNYATNWTDLHVDYLRIEYFVDDTPPVTTILLDPPAPNGDNGWYRTAVQVTLSAADDASGVREIRYRVDGGPWAVYSGPFPVSADGSHTVEAYAVDYAGNTESPPKSASFRIDATPPAISWSAPPPDGDNGWYRLPITVTFTCSDGTSGVAFCEPEGILTAEGTNLTRSGTARDQAGNTASTTAGPFQRDATPPTVTAVISPALPDGLGGWWITGPAVSFACSDVPSGVAFCSPPISVTTEGITTVMGMAEDFAGWATTVSKTLKVDLSPPSVGLVMPASWCFACSGPIPIGLRMADGVSGVGSWALRLEVRGLSRIFTGTTPVESVGWDGWLEGQGVQPGDRVAVTLIVTDVAGHEGAIQAFLDVVAPSPPPPSPTFTATPSPTPSPMPTRTPARVRPTPTRRGETPEPVPSTPEPVPTERPTPSPSPTPRPVPAVPAAAVGVVFLDWDGDGQQGPGEPGIPGAVVEVAGQRIPTGPDGRFYLPAGLRANLVQLPLRGRLTVADGLRFGVQPLRRPWWLLGLVAGMILLGLTGAWDPRPEAVRRLTRILREGGRR